MHSRMTIKLFIKTIWEKKKNIILALPQKTFKTAIRLGTKVRIEKLIKRQKQIRLAKAMKKFSSSTEDTVIAIHLRN